MSGHECPTCGRSFDSRRGLGVHHTRSHGRQLPNRTCAECGAKFNSSYEKKYCSDACRRRNTSYEGTSNPNYNGGKTQGNCEFCGTEFEYYPSAKKGRFCPECVQTRNWQRPPSATGTDNPRWNGGKRPVDCIVCGTTVERYPSNIGSVTVCSENCRGAWLSTEFSGPGHPNWKGGTNLSYGAGWSDVRERALSRDGHQCVTCETTRDELGRNPDVHHIIPVRWFIDSDNHEREDAHFIENVVTLCPSCHRKAEFGKISRDTLRSLIGM